MKNSNSFKKLWTEKEKRYALFVGTGIFATLMGYTSFMLAPIVGITITSTFLSYLTLNVVGYIAKLANKILETVEDADKILKTTHAQIEPFTKKLHTTLENTDKNIDALTGKIEETLDNIDEKSDFAVYKLNITLDSVNKNLSAIQKTLGDLHGATETVSTYTAPVALLAKGLRWVAGTNEQEEQSAESDNVNVNHEKIETPQTINLKI